MAFMIRLLRTDDVPAVVALSLRAWEPVFASFAQVLGPRIYPMVYPDWRTAQAEAVAQVCTEMPETTWVAVTDAGPIGFIATVLRPDPAATPTAATPTADAPTADAPTAGTPTADASTAGTLTGVTPTAEIEMLAVDPAHQKRGAASALIDFALDRLREAGVTLVDVTTGGDPGHAPARRTYERAGFTALPLVHYYRAL